MTNGPAFPTLLCVLGFFIVFILFFLTLSIRVVQEDKRLAVYRLGRYIGDKGPGIVFLLPTIDKGVMKDAGSAGVTASYRAAGMEGETRTTVFTEGKVFVNGQEWDAVSQSPIPAGSTVKVLRTILEVEKK